MTPFSVWEMCRAGCCLIFVPWLLTHTKLSCEEAAYLMACHVSRFSSFFTASKLSISRADFYNFAISLHPTLSTLNTIIVVLGWNLHGSGSLEIGEFKCETVTIVQKEK